MSGTRLFSINVGGSGGSGTITGRTQTATVLASVSQTAVVFSTPMSSADYTVLTSISNLVDTDPIFLQVVSIVKSTTGFTALFNAPTDSANYLLEYLVADHV